MYRIPKHSHHLCMSTTVPLAFRHRQASALKLGLSVKPPIKYHWTGFHCDSFNSTACYYHSGLGNAGRLQFASPQPFGTGINLAARWYSTEPSRSETSKSKNASMTTSKEQTSELKQVYTAPITGHVTFHLVGITGSGIGLFGLILSPLYYLFGYHMKSALYLLVGLSVPMIAHKLCKHYVVKMYYNEKTEMVRVYTLSALGIAEDMLTPKFELTRLILSAPNRLFKFLKSPSSAFSKSKPSKRKDSVEDLTHEFHISEAGPPSAGSLFMTFKAEGMPYFIHTNAFSDKELLSRLGVHVQDRKQT